MQADPDASSRGPQTTHTGRFLSYNRRIPRVPRPSKIPVDLLHPALRPLTPRLFVLISRVLLLCMSLIVTALYRVHRPITLGSHR